MARLFSALICVFLLTVPGLAMSLTVQDSNLFLDLWGFGGSTTGGLGGDIYVVNSTADSGEEGTLRYAIESLSGPVWIVFHPQIFPPNVQTIIDLQSPLRFSYRNDVTIDGRESYVTLRRVMASPCAGVGGGEVIQIQSSQNIILTHLEYSRLYAGTDPSDKEACGDIVQLFNDPSEISVPDAYYDRIWINQSNFDDCGDECIGITRYNQFDRAYMTISRNEFLGAQSVYEKGILAGLEGAEVNPYGVAITLFRNRFYNIPNGLPRMAHGYLHAYNNAFENWGAFGIAATTNTRVILENNVFRSTSSSLKDDAWEVSGSDSFLWANDNLFWTLSGTCPTPPAGTDPYCETSNFPVCYQEGGPWYYDCPKSYQAWEIAQSLDFNFWLEHIRFYAGWTHALNDVRESLTGIEGQPRAAHAVEWVGATPNPFNPSTRLRFRTERAGDATLRLYSAAGREIQEIVLRGVGPGEHELLWNGTDATGARVASGVYLVRVEADGATATGRVVLVK